MKLFGELEAVIQQIESALNVRLTDEDFADGREELLHVFTHEACHAAVSHRIPWIHELDEQDHTVLDEVLARLLEERIGLALGLYVHSPEEHVRELSRYPVEITVEQYEHLYAEWRRRYWPARDLEGMASYALSYLRGEGAADDTARAAGKEEQLCAVLVGSAPTSEKAEAVARNSQGCPYVAFYAAADRMVVAVFALPRSKRWWIEYPQEHPELLGLERVVVHVTDRIEPSSPWTRGDVTPTLSMAPCGTDCERCPQYRDRCSGCPATTYDLPGMQT
jgi:hypothetical protein